jgi:hypothetical protein
MADMQYLIENNYSLIISLGKNFEAEMNVYECDFQWRMKCRSSKK